MTNGNPSVTEVAVIGIVVISGTVATCLGVLSPDAYAGILGGAVGWGGRAATGGNG